MSKTNKTRREQSGVYIGESKGFINSLRRLFGADRSVVIPSNYSGPLAIIGGSGSGKTAGLVLNTLCRTYRKGSFFAIDLKGELLGKYAQANPGANFKTLSLRGESKYTYDPFDFIRKDGDDNLVSNMRELVNALLPLPANIPDPFWVYSAREFLTAGFLYFFDMRLSFIEAVINIMTTPPTTLVNKIASRKNTVISSFVNNFIGADNSDSKLLVGIGQEVTNRLSVIANDPRIRKALSPSGEQVQWADLDSCNIFLSVPEDRLEQYAPVVTMLITQLCRFLERRPERHSIEGADRNQILVMLDEFPRLGKLDIITSAVSTLRSKNVTICMILQSLAQLDAVYGREIRRIILENCSYLAVLSVNDVESQKYFAERVGTVLAKKRSKSTSYLPKKEGINPVASVRGKVTGYSEQVSESREYAIHPHQFASFSDVLLITPDGHTMVKKYFYHETSGVAKLREGIVNVVKKVAEVVGNVLNAAKKRASSFFGLARHSIWRLGFM